MRKLCLTVLVLLAVAAVAPGCGDEEEQDVADEPSAAQTDAPADDRGASGDEAGARQSGAEGESLQECQSNAEAAGEAIRGDADEELVRELVDVYKELCEVSGERSDSADDDRLDELFRRRCVVEARLQPEGQREQAEEACEQIGAEEGR